MADQEQILKALQHPTRQEILYHLHEYSAAINYSDLLPLCDESTGKLNYHLRILEDLIVKNSQGYDLSEKGRTVVAWLNQLDQERKLQDKSRPSIVFDKIYPDKKLFYKFSFQTAIVFLLLILPSLGLVFLEFIFIYAVVLELILLGVTLWFLQKYTQSIWYRFTETEVEVHKGVITFTHKMVPYRTVTNVDQKQGPFDRLFGISTVDIHTAGVSANATGPAEKIVGMVEGGEIRETLLEKIRLLNPIDFLTASQERKGDPINRGLLAINSALKEINKDLEEIEE